MPKWLIIVIILFVLIVIVSIASGEDKPTSAGKNDNNVTSTEKEKISFESNETVTYENVEYKITNIECSQGTEFDKSSDGNEYLIVTINIINKSNNKVSYNAFNWKLTNSNGQKNNETFSIINNNTALNSGDLAVNGNVTGSIVFEIPSGDSNMKLSYYKTILHDNATFYCIVMCLQVY